MNKDRQEELDYIVGELIKGPKDKHRALLHCRRCTNQEAIVTFKQLYDNIPNCHECDTPMFYVKDL